MPKIGFKVAEATKIKIRETMKSKKLGFQKGYIPTEEQKRKRMENIVIPKGDKSWSWKGGKPNCLVCNKKLSTRKSLHCYAHKVVIFSEDALKRIGDAHRGEKSLNWISDRTKLAKRQERNDYAYVDWRKQVWSRDEFHCQIADSDCEGKIEAHHILGWSSYPKLRYQVNNGITLCHAHHPRKRAEEKRLVPLFQELVSVSK